MAFVRRWADSSLMSGRGNYPRAGWGGPRGAHMARSPAPALKYRSASEPSRRKMQWIGGDGRPDQRSERPPARRLPVGPNASGHDERRSLSRAATIGSLACGAFVRFFANQERDRLGQRAPHRCAFTSVAPQQRRNASLLRRNTSPLGAQIVLNRRSFASGPLQQPKDFFQCSGQNQLTPGRQ